MTSDNLPATAQGTDQKRELALLKAIGFDRLSPEQREIALNLAARYNLDPLLRHIVLVDGKPYITRDGLLWIAHRSRQLDGIKVTRPVKEGTFWRAEATVWRKDMTHPIEFTGRFPVGAKNDEEMAIKVAESMAYRRAFNVSAPTVDERWANDDAPDELPAAPRPSGLADLARQKAAAVQEATQAAQDGASGPELLQVITDATPDGSAALCGVQAAEGLMLGSVCELQLDHKGPHKVADGSWPR